MHITWAETRTQAQAPDAPGAAGQVRSVYVGNLPPSVNEDKLLQLFSAYGEVRVCAGVCVLECVCVQLAVRVCQPGTAVTCRW